MGVSLFAIAACGTPKAAPTDTPVSARPDPVATPAEPVNPATAVRLDSAAYLAQVTRLEAEARALAKTTGCNAAEGCRTAPVGERGCGGPRSYLVYCAATTDSVALFRKLGELRQAETKYNASSGMLSTCEFRMPPDVVSIGGSCRAKVP